MSHPYHCPTRLANVLMESNLRGFYVLFGQDQLGRVQHVSFTPHPSLHVMGANGSATIQVDAVAEAIAEDAFQAAASRWNWDGVNKEELERLKQSRILQGI